ncbi:FAD-binding domain-containing protein [Annulohypoxylon truncatum]|uniref:FAD-binding domain-containing protein n=1 Tax=Annulohypoxylon truncatum TaxID=327061 RepID=UPI0020079ED6|nr:FAD-binding domain-containing protein [Annulohypoxylon truncatum]KAI1205458.1 FAD-binding domain-containing protein [Annulohypoxylon truncatum]
MPDPSNLQIYDALASVVKGSILQPGSKEYEADNGSYFSAFENGVQPSYIVKPSNANEVQGLIRALRPHILSGDCQIAIRGGGHTPFAGSANIQDGVTIDMRALKGINLSEDKSVVEIGVGETWATVYAELEKHGLTVAGARTGRIGVAGFILGGGLSMFSPRVGFSCDSVVEFEVVLASGELVHANATENSDLWVSLKGGLNNFGILTSFKMRAFKSTDIWGGITFYMSSDMIDTFSKLIHNAYDFVNNEEDLDAHAMFSIGYGFGHQAVTCVMYHTQSKENPPSLQRFTSLENQVKEMCTLRKSTHLGFTEELSKHSSDGKRQYWASFTIKPDIFLMEAFHRKWQDMITEIKDVNGLTFSFGFHPLTKAMLDSSARAEGNAIAIPPSDGPLFIVLVNPGWDLPEDDSKVYTIVGNFVADLRKLATDKELLHRYIFMNYAYQMDDPIMGYGEESVHKLKETSKKYDPEGIFQKGVPGGFKLPGMGA